MQSHIYLFNYTVTVILGNAFGNLGEEGLEWGSERSSMSSSWSSSPNSSGDSGGLGEERDWGLEPPLAPLLPKAAKARRYRAKEVAELWYSASWVFKCARKLQLKANFFWQISQLKGLSPMFKILSVSRISRPGSVLVLTWVQKQVIFQIRLLAKTSLTYVTFKGPSASMNISMRFEITWGRKGFGTHCALMRLFL